MNEFLKTFGGWVKDLVLSVLLVVAFAFTFIGGVVFHEEGASVLKDLAPDVAERLSVGEPPPNIKAGDFLGTAVRSGSP